MELTAAVDGRDGDALAPREARELGVLHRLLGQAREIRRGGVLAMAVVAAGIDELRVAQPQRGGALVHACDEGDAEVVGERAAGVVRRAHHHRGEEIARAQLVARLEANAAPGLARGGAAHGDDVVEASRFERDERAHHLGEARRRHAQLRIAGPDDQAVALHEIRVGNARKTILHRVRRPRGEEDCDEGYLPNRPLSLLMPCVTPCCTACFGSMPERAAGWLSSSRLLCAR